MTCLLVSMGKEKFRTRVWPRRDSRRTYLHIGMDARPSSSSTTGAANTANVGTPRPASDSDLRVVRAADTASGWAVLQIRAPWSGGTRQSLLQQNLSFARNRRVQERHPPLSK